MKIQIVHGIYKIVWAFEFDKDLNFQGITEEEFKSEDYKIYLYKGEIVTNSYNLNLILRITEPKKLT